MANENDKNSEAGFPNGYLQALPNSTPVMVLGILSICMCWFFGFLSFVFAIIALVLASSAEKEYARRPDYYTVSSYKNMKAGKLCAIIGLCLGLLSLLIVFGFLFFGFALWSTLLP